MFVIGLVGPFGSGCSTVAEYIKNERKYVVISLSDILRKLYSEKYPDSKCTRDDLQDFGDAIRQENGYSYLAEEAFKKITEEPGRNYVIDSIRNPNEVSFLRRKLPEFYLLGVFADADIRWSREKKKSSSIYQNDERKFKEHDARDSGEKIEYGQRVTDTFRGADVVLLNNSEISPGNEAETDFKYKLLEKLDIIEHEMPFKPTSYETNMAIAYACSMRSSCSKRKVGAIIVDASGNIFSSGYNEVPMTKRSCKREYGVCYRDKLKDEFKKSLNEKISDEKTIETAYGVFKKQFKILDYCRALHAEENAILNVARSGSSSALSKATLYTSTYPCNLCANKIVQVGIKEIVYFEPYPMEEAKKILAENHVSQIPFEGVTYNGYFRLMEVIY